MLRRILLTLGLGLGLTAIAWAEPRTNQTDAIEDILKLADQGVSDAIIVKHIEASGVVFQLTADDILELHDRGIHDAVIEAMLDTAPKGEPATGDANTVVPDDEAGDYASGDTDVEFNLSAGYFSPWYHYPAAWGFYYDPFPVCYSAYYYPFNFYSSWGWYGSCNYWYPHQWASYRYCDPYYWNHGGGNHPGAWVRAPRPQYASRWQAGRGMPARNGTSPAVHVGEAAHGVAQASPRLVGDIPVERVHVGEPTSGRAAVVHHPSRGGSRYATRYSKDRVHTSQPGRPGRSVGEAVGRARYSAGASAPRSAPHVGAVAAAPHFGSPGGSRLPMGGAHLR